MSLENHIQEQIDRYLDGVLSASERETFEKQMAQDLELNAWVQAEEVARAIVVGHEMLELKARMQQEMNNPKRSKRPYFLGTSAVLLMLGLGGVYLLNYNKNKETQKPEKVVDSLKPSIEAEIKQESSVERTEQNQPSTERFKFSESSSVMVPVESGNKPLEATEPVAQFQPQSQERVISPVLEKICGDTLVSGLEVNARPTCQGTSDGSIKVLPASVKWGKAPYKVKWQRGVWQNVENEINFLEEGVYRLQIRDANNCIYTVKEDIEVKAKACTQPQAFTFSPAQETEWIFPVNPGKEVEWVSIMNRSGLVIYEQVSGGMVRPWNGESNKGLNVPAGYYIYSIKYSDGMIDKGSITVFR